MTPYTPPAFKATAFHCPMCGAFSNQVWHRAGVFRGAQSIGLEVPKFMFAHCQHCRDHSVWLDGRMVYPNSGSAPLPNPDMPEAIKDAYLEARDIAARSPRGAAALLRLAVQMLCEHVLVADSKKNINQDIAELVRRGLPQKFQKALDSVRIVGNNAVHPGELDLHDNPTIAHNLFLFLNVLCDNLISQDNAIAEFYKEEIPEKDKQNIERRDAR